MRRRDADYCSGTTPGSGAATDHLRPTAAVAQLPHPEGIPAAGHDTIPQLIVGELVQSFAGV
jgi:hypothetical protein